MPRLGRPPTPVKLRVLNGNPSKRPIPNAPEPKVEKLSAPAYLDTNAKSEWRRITPELAKLGLLSKMDRSALAGYCQAWSDFRRARRHLVKDEDFVQATTGGGAASAWKRLSDEALKQIRQFCAEFGLSPAARVRLATAPIKKSDQVANDESFRNERTAKG